MANNNSDLNPSLIIFALFIVFASGGKALIPLLIFYFFYRMFAGGGSGIGRGGGGNSRNQRRDDRQRDYRRRNTDFDRDRETRRTNPSPRTEQREERTRQRSTRNTRRVRKDNPYKKSGMEKYKEYDYKGAIEDFEKALTIDNQDIATHFNIACAYSIMEEKEKSFFHLSKAVELGYSDTEKIKTHDALAYLRIQDEFESFVQNGYKLKTGTSSQQEQISSNNDLLEQLNKLAELREKGLLTQEEFELQKKKLLK